MNNFFTHYDWNTLIHNSSINNTDYSVAAYHDILCQPEDYPEFLDKYIALPALQRLAGIGLLCGSDWTKLFNNRFYYSRLDHSIGVALIIWHFTHDKAQTISGLLHDISTSVFSHVSDFRKGDALNQTITEGPTAYMIRNDQQLQELLKADGLASCDVEDYHKYPVADNEIPQLSADRLEYMFPSGMAMCGNISMKDVSRMYADIEVLVNQDGLPELGFKTKEIAEEYCRFFCLIGHALQLNEDKLSLQLLGVIMNQAVELGVLTEADFMTLSEREVIGKIEKFISTATCHSAPDHKLRDRNGTAADFARLYHTFRNMTKVEHTEQALPTDKYFSISLKVKQRYINPLTVCSGGEGRLYDLSPMARQIIDDFKSFNDTAYGCVPLI